MICLLSTLIWYQFVRFMLKSPEINYLKKKLPITVRSLTMFVHVLHFEQHSKILLIVWNLVGSREGLGTCITLVNLVFSNFYIFFTFSGVMIFYTNGLLINLLFFKMATRWPSLMNMCYDVEKSVKCHPQTNIKKQIRIITIVMMVATTSKLKFWKIVKEADNKPFNHLCVEN